MSTFKLVNRKRKTAINRITEILGIASKAKTDPTQHNLFKTAYENLEQVYDEFKNLHNDCIGLLEDDNEFDAQDAIRKGTDGFYFTIKEIFRTIFSENDNANNSDLPASQSREVRLPKLTVPIFDGDLRKWPMFFDMFNSLVNGNQALQDIQKFQYLLSFLQGEPLHILRSIQTIGENYNIAFSTLKKRYQNKRILATSYWNAIVNAPVAKNNSAKDLRSILDTFEENIAGLQTLGFPVKEWCFVLFNILLQKVDKSIRTAFEVKYSEVELPTYKNLEDFLSNHCKALESIQYMPSVSSGLPSSVNRSSKSPSSSNENFPKNQWRSNTTSALFANTSTEQQNSSDESGQFSKSESYRVSQNKCKLCKNQVHPLSQCSLFIAKSPVNRYEYVKKEKACLNCLRYTHLLKDCPSTFNCKICKYRHHTTLHLPPSSKTASPNSISKQPLSQRSVETPPNSLDQELKEPAGFNGTALSSNLPLTTVLLATALVNIQDARGHNQVVTVLLDSGSQANFISESCLNRLGLKRQKSTNQILGLNNSSSNTKGMSRCTISPIGKEGPIYSINIHVVSKLCSDMPAMEVNPATWSYISTLSLGDKRFNVPGPIDMLLGADVFSQVLKSGRVTGPVGHPNALETEFGWVLIGPTQDVCIESTKIEQFFLEHNPSLEATLRKFWELETLPSKNFVSPDDKKCESIFQSTTKRENSGRFIVDLPFKHSEPDLGDTYSVAYRCLISLERKLSKDADLYCQYSDFMKNYLKNGHMTLISNKDPMPIIRNYLPHLCVVTPNKVSTKLRVVFNASAKGPKGLSLNDTLLTGAKLQSDITEILLKFRFHAVVFLADIKQMYLQILVNPNHRRFQRLLWRFNFQDPIQEYELNCVTFGMNCSPYLAIRTLKELAYLESANYPKACQVILDNIFMDDICAGCPSLEESLALQKELIALLKSAGFELKKWASNRSELLANLAPDDCQIPIPLDQETLSETQPSIKVLGLQWSPKDDVFSYNYSSSDNKPCTKRQILSDIARIYDPLGFLSPVTFLAKHIMQKLWASGVGWDETPPEHIVDLWNKFKIELSAISKLSIPRYIFDRNIQRCQILGFCDASESGYASSVYLRTELPGDQINSHLIIGKSRVAPLRTVSLPRLELLGATLLADTLAFVIKTYSSLIVIDDICAFTDSEVVLAWISSSPHKWKTFVANRVSHIQECIPNVKWYHVPSLENPADCASRGLTPCQLTNHPLWFRGPPWIQTPISNWELNKGPSASLEVHQEEKPLVLSLTVDHPSPDEDDSIIILVQNISNLNKIQRIVGYCLRYYRFLKDKQIKLSAPFTAGELHSCLLVLVKVFQQKHLADLFGQIQNNQIISKPYQKLAPFIDGDSLIRVGGRLKHADIPFDVKHPILLPRKSRLTDLIIDQIHRQNLHPGLNTVQYLLRQKFWIPSAKRAIFKVLSKCIRCLRLRPRAYTPFMGDLPSFRVTQLKCFANVSLDYAGPLKISMSRYRGAKILKSYVCIFVCCATKAIHIELVSDLTSEAFIAALRRFVARRGNVIKIISDNGTNFVGANRQLKELSQYAAGSLNIEWHFNPPAAPHFNTLSESGVKSVKTHLHRVIGEQILTYEELYTLLTQIEALLNSRPLWEQSSDPNDLSPLTPGHFLTMNALNTCPDPDLSHLKLSALSRWQLIQRLHADFWKRWRNEYLHTLQERSKWTRNSEHIQLNKLVVLKDESKPPLQWSMGRVVALHPGQDKIVRVVTVKTKDGLFKRPVVKICPLPAN